MNQIRQAKTLTRFVLMWFVLSLSVAMASPLVSPKTLDMVCTTGGALKFVASDDAGDPESNTHTMDCALCMVVVIPSTSACAQFTKPSALAHALHPIAAALIAAATAPPLPSRGPPAL